MTLWRMRIGCWITTATNTHTECVVLIACSLQQWLSEHTSILLYTYIANLVFTVRKLISNKFVYPIISNCGPGSSVGIAID